MKIYLKTAVCWNCTPTWLKMELDKPKRTCREIVIKGSNRIQGSPTPTPPPPVLKISSFLCALKPFFPLGFLMARFLPFYSFPPAFPAPSSELFTLLWIFSFPWILNRDHILSRPLPPLPRHCVSSPHFVLRSLSSHWWAGTRSHDVVVAIAHLRPVWRWCAQRASGASCRRWMSAVVQGQLVRRGSGGKSVMGLGFQLSVSKFLASLWSLHSLIWKWD